MQRRSFIRATGAVAATLAVPGVFAQEWPSAPVRIIVGFPPGGGTDALARVVAQKLTAMWNQQVIVETKAGVAGVLAAEYVAGQPSDGSTLLMAHINSHALAPCLQPKLRYNTERDFVPIVLIGVTPNLLIANPAQSAKTVKDIVALCKAQPGMVSFGSAGAGSAQHLALEMFKLRAKVSALHIPYKGSGPLLQDLIGGQIQYSFETMTAATPRPHDSFRTTPNELENVVLNLVGEPNRYRLPAFYELHVWAWRDNPDGSFADWNPLVSCDSQQGD